MATKKTTKTPKPSNTNASVTQADEHADEVADAFRAPRKTRLTLRSSHGSKASAPKTTPRAAPAKKPTPTRSVPPQAVPPRPKRTTRTAASTTEAAALALSIARSAIDKKANNVEIIDLAGKADYADYLVVMTGTSDRHVRALSDAIQEDLLKSRVKPISIEGISAGSWVLIDFGHVVAHVFQETTRSLYDIEGLWLDAARLPL